MTRTIFRPWKHAWTVSPKEIQTEIFLLEERKHGRRLQSCTVPSRRFRRGAANVDKDVEFPFQTSGYRYHSICLILLFFWPGY